MREVPLGSRTGSFLSMEWLEAGAYVLTCARGGALQGFAARPAHGGS